MSRNARHALPAVDAVSGFTTHDFDALGHLAPVEAARALGPKIESLLMAVNEQRTAGRIVELRNRAGQSGSKLFHRNSYHDGGNGYIHAYHHGGRWEPQFNLGFLSDTPWGGNWMRVGPGFNLAGGGRDDQVDGQERMVRYFELFQQQLGSAWRRQLADWMGTSGGFIQYGSRGPALDVLPPQAVEWLINCRNPAGQAGSLWGAGCRSRSPPTLRSLATSVRSSPRSKTRSPRCCHSGRLSTTLPPRHTKDTRCRAQRTDGNAKNRRPEEPKAGE